VSGCEFAHSDRHRHAREEHDESSKRDDHDCDFEAGIGERGGKEACEKCSQRRHQRSGPVATDSDAGQGADCKADYGRA
jgi:hypothetical protein